ncbi:MAG: M23 family metallopeptidase [bacterium]
MNRWLPPLAMLAGVVACGPPPPTAQPVGPSGPLSMVIRPADADEPPDVVGVWYTVQKGDFLTALAQKYGVPPEDIIEVNALDHPERLEVGQRLFMPGIEKLVARAAPPPGTGRAQQQKKDPAPRTTGRAPTRFTWPVTTGELTVGFGKRGGQEHRGIDVRAPRKTPIYAVADGKVVYSDTSQPGYGHLIIVRLTAATWSPSTLITSAIWLTRATPFGKVRKSPRWEARGRVENHTCTSRCE